MTQRTFATRSSLNHPLRAAVVVLSFSTAAAVLLATHAGCSNTPPAASPADIPTALPVGDGPRVLAADLDRLTGAPWRGTLTYLDYTSKKPTEIRSTLAFTRTTPEPAEPSWTMSIGYTDEPHADSGEVVILRQQGRVFREETIIERAELPDGRGVRFVAEADGQDDRRDARIRHVYTITAHEFTLQKLVRFREDSEFFERHVYRWTR